ncbi:hypothetical protein, conserved [Trypanosoma brucei gambiense DAL972]|uniref:Uncharacterized protein n=2 Tax=Trypanosoma brucei TaxID=5691 RepID=C9ZN84_TRYB9|nr:hypothetical protein, conserved [Trypanosoma brucei gambiense DAL972]RHW73239.1 hypothetical protein DPX39_040073300 [Trypanosoma brucei equiperdum]CBH10738.1 hypothetical protein, conserved [Trypanosoma brucei gambiense DAL972]|eukprot:XP_011773026.1 hypothetical protein, conserved [Trypanosoma brucei gambiense DAL972]
METESKTTVTSGAPWKYNGALVRDPTKRKSSDLLPKNLRKCPYCRRFGCSEHISRCGQQLVECSCCGMEVEMARLAAHEEYYCKGRERSQTRVLCSEPPTPPCEQKSDVSCSKGHVCEDVLPSATERTAQVCRKHTDRKVKPAVSNGKQAVETNLKGVSPECKIKGDDVQQTATHVYPVEPPPLPNTVQLEERTAVGALTENPSERSKMDGEVVRQKLSFSGFVKASHEVLKDIKNCRSHATHSTKCNTTTSLWGASRRLSGMPYPRLRGSSAFGAFTGFSKVAKGNVGVASRTETRHSRQQKDDTLTETGPSIPPQRVCVRSKSAAAGQ